MLPKVYPRYNLSNRPHFHCNNTNRCETRIMKYELMMDNMPFGLSMPHTHNVALYPPERKNSKIYNNLEDTLSERKKQFVWIFQMRLIVVNEKFSYVDFSRIRLLKSIQSFHLGAVRNFHLLVVCG